MSEFETGGREFAIDFLNYYDKYGINDEFDKRTQKMVPSAGVLALVKQAKSIFPERAAGEQKKLNDSLTKEQVDEAIASDSNVLDTREMFAKRVARNGGTHALLRALYKGEPGASEAVLEFLQAEDGEKEFAKSE